MILQVSGFPVLKESRCGSAAAAAAAAADPPNVAGLPRSSSQQGVSADAPEEPTLQSSVAQQAASNAQAGNASSINVLGHTPGLQSLEPAAGEVSAGEEDGAETEGGVEGRLESSSGEPAGGPEEPALQSGLGQQAASMEDGMFLSGLISLCFQLCYHGHTPDL